MFITLEGPEGSGKTSHIPYLVEFLREKGYIVFPTLQKVGTYTGIVTRAENCSSDSTIRVVG